MEDHGSASDGELRLEVFQGNPYGSSFLRWLGKFLFRLFGWQPGGKLPESPSFVAIGAPHTSNWDLPVAIAMMLSFGIKIHWMAKDAIFRPPFGWIFRRLGGIPIDRSAPHNIVTHIVELFKKRDQFIVGLTPEGTRSRVEYWKTGFYYMAYEANVPLVLAYFDYKRKIGGLGPTIIPSGDLEADLEIMKDFYANITPKFPENFGEIKIRPRDEDRAGNYRD